MSLTRTGSIPLAIRLVHRYFRGYVQELYITGATAEQPSLRRIGLFGGTGFVGAYLVDALLASNFHHVELVRDGSEANKRKMGRIYL